MTRSEWGDVPGEVVRLTEVTRGLPPIDPDALKNIINGPTQDLWLLAPRPQTADPLTSEVEAIALDGVSQSNLGFAFHVPALERILDTLNDGQQIEPEPVGKDWVLTTKYTREASDAVELALQPKEGSTVEAHPISIKFLRFSGSNFVVTIAQGRDQAEFHSHPEGYGFSSSIQQREQNTKISGDFKHSRVGQPVSYKVKSEVGRLRRPEIR